MAQGHGCESMPQFGLEGTQFNWGSRQQGEIQDWWITRQSIGVLLPEISDLCERMYEDIVVRRCYWMHWERMDDRYD